MIDRRRCFNVALGCVAVCWSTLAQGDPPKIAGKYCFSGGEKEEAELRRELDGVADQFNFFVRSVARKKLHQRVRPYDAVEMEGARDAMRVHLGDQVSLVCDGQWHDVTGTDGEDGKALCDLDGLQLKTRSEYDRATRINTFSFSKDGKSATMEAVLRSPKLPDTIRFELSYSDC